MTLFVSESGEKFEIDEVTPAIAAEIRQRKLKPAGDDAPALRDFLKSSMSGITEGVARAPLLGGDIIKLGMTLGNKLGDKEVPFFSPERIDSFGSQGWVDAFKGSPQDQGLKSIGLDATYDPQTKAGRYVKAGTSAVAGAATTAGLGSLGSSLNAAKVALGPGSAGINAASGLAGEAAYDVSRGFDDTKQGNPLVAALAGVATGAAGNAVRNAARSNYPNDLYDATKSLRPEDWAGAHASLKRFRSTDLPGTTPAASPFTLGDLPELQPAIGGVTRGLSNAPGGNALNHKLSTLTRGNIEVPRLLRQAQEPTIPWGAATTDAAEATIRGMRRINPDQLDAQIAQNMSPTQALQVAEVLGRRLQPVSNLSKGQAAQNDRRLYQALINYGDAGASPAVRKNLEAADSLSRLTAEGGIERTVQMNMGKNATDMVSPGRLFFRNALRVARNETEDLSGLLSNPTPQNLRKLQELAKIDPRAKRALEFISNWGGALSSSSVQRTE